MLYTLLYTKYSQGKLVKVYKQKITTKNALKIQHTNVDKNPGLWGGGANAALKPAPPPRFLHRLGCATSNPEEQTAVW